jgi:16S rRNA processing protein RimM
LTEPDLITVGKLGRPRGIHGEMYITPMTDFPDRFLGLKEIYLGTRGAWEKITVVSSRLVSGRPVIELEKVTSKEIASRYTNRDLAVPRDQLVDLPEDTYFVFDLIGAEVINEATGEKVGELIDVVQYPANDVYVIRGLDGTELLCPAIKEFVREIDAAAKRVVVVASGLVSK